MSAQRRPLIAGNWKMKQTQFSRPDFFAPWGPRPLGLKENFQGNVRALVGVGAGPKNPGPSRRAEIEPVTSELLHYVHPNPLSDALRNIQLLDGPLDKLALPLFGFFLVFALLFRQLA